MSRVILFNVLIPLLLSLSASCSSPPEERHEAPDMQRVPTLINEEALTPTANLSGTDVQATDVSPKVDEDESLEPIMVPHSAFGPTDVADLVARAKPSVVNISVEVVQTNYFGQRIRGTAAGSGVIFDSRGLILTNNHVVADASRIVVTMTDTRQFEAGLVGRDPLTDLAVIKFTEDVKVQPLPLGNSDNLRIGEWVVAIGNALGLDGAPTVTVGVVGAKSRTVGPLSSGIYLHNMIQTDAAINPGNSGGPLIDLTGQVVGINSAILAGANGIGFSIASNTAMAVADQLVKHGRVVWPWIGITASDVTPQVAFEYGLGTSQGVLVRALEPNGPADRSSLEVADVIIRVAGEATPDTLALQRATRKSAIGETIEVIVLRDGEEMSVSVTLQEMPRP